MCCGYLNTLLSFLIFPLFFFSHILEQLEKRNLLFISNVIFQYIILFLFLNVFYSQDTWYVANWSNLSMWSDPLSALTYLPNNVWMHTNSVAIPKTKKRKQCNLSVSDRKGSFLHDTRPPPNNAIMFITFFLTNSCSGLTVQNNSGLEVNL